MLGVLRRYRLAIVLAFVMLIGLPGYFLRTSSCLSELRNAGWRDHARMILEWRDCGARR